ncbi:type II toxin-antitoxin system RelE/ParE family toxin [Pseudomonas sp. UFMG81]|uniref:type II toxin-antitoxin system RelE/ParE family toxin n=1 Tax=Pseudomonas sp. UFMG81 TaxID=2745936 RepID=UPI001E646A4F|nr:type II toxin-antitoxin system RelE/ParE family toxin [Pseudomonas sp. UFMG81]
MPADVQDVFGFALHQAQEGGRHLQAKVLKGFSGSGVLEVVEDHFGDTYRAVYTICLVDAVYVLHCFQKKSRSGIKTSKQDIDLINARLKMAQAHSKGKTT